MFIHCMSRSVINYCSHVHTLHVHVMNNAIELVYMYSST